jgi:hypothetical protein
MKTGMTESEKQAAKSRLLMLFPHPIGKAKSIGMGDLYESVFGESYDHRINGTRRRQKEIFAYEVQAAK